MSAPLAELLGFDPEGTNWRDSALCAQVDTELFFPEKGGSTKDAKRVCASCEVRSECLDFAVGNGERFGIWGGLSERERRRLHPATPAVVRERRQVAIDHGTEAGYKAHRRLGEDACRPCKDGLAEAQRLRVAERLAAEPPAEQAPVVQLRPGRDRPWSADELREAVRLLTDYGMSPGEIAAELRVPVRRVRAERGAA